MAMNEVNPLSFIRRVIPNTADKINAETFKQKAALGLQGADNAAKMRQELAKIKGARIKQLIASGYGATNTDAEQSTAASRTRKLEDRNLGITGNKGIADIAEIASTIGAALPNPNASIAERGNITAPRKQVLPRSAIANAATNLKLVNTKEVSGAKNVGKKGLVQKFKNTEQLTGKGSGLAQLKAMMSPQVAPTGQTMVNTSGVTDPLMLSGIEFAKQKYGPDATIIPTSEGIKVTTKDGNFLLRKENIAKAIGQ
jgi:hypothetical protein